MTKLTPLQIQQELAKVPEWNEFGGQIQRTFQFRDFVEAMAFVNRVATQAEIDQHHPDILVRYNKVTLTVSTHDAGGITHKDFDLARKADGFSAATGVVTTPPKPAKRTAKT